MFKKMLAAFTVLVLIMRTASQSCQYANSVQLTDRSYNGVKYLDGEYYVDNNTKAERGCVCMKETCFRKCCPPGQAYNSSKDVNNCVPEPHKFHLPVYNKYNNMELIKGFNATENFHFLYGKMTCSKAKNEKRFSTAESMANLRVMTDGNLYVKIPSGFPNVFIYSPDKYCIDTFVSNDEEPQLKAFICYIVKPERNSYELSSSCMLISCFFILLTIAVYAWLPELRNLHGMVLMAYLLCFFVGFLFLAIMQIFILQKQISQNLCTIITFIIYFSLLSAFFWLNVMCYDIWKTFSGIRAHGRSPKKSFMYYAIYAFGVPTALTIILGALEFSDLHVQHPLLPNLRLQGCFLYGYSKLLYLYGPIVLLCVANMIFFGLTAFKIRKIKKETKMLRGRESSTHDQNRKETRRFSLYVKLFTVMGINWIMEVVSSFYPDADFVWQFTDAYNVLVGLIIFIIFVWKKKTWKMIKKRYRQLKGDPMSRTQTITSTTKDNSSRRTSKLLIPRRNTNELH